MPTTAKISISLPRETLEAADRARKASGESRSEFIRHAIDALLRQRKEQAAVKEYVAGYVAEPESESEADRAHEWASEVFDGEPWD